METTDQLSTVGWWVVWWEDRGGVKVRVKGEDSNPGWYRSVLGKLCGWASVPVSLQQSSLDQYISTERSAWPMAAAVASGGEHVRTLN